MTSDDETAINFAEYFSNPENRPTVSKAVIRNVHLDSDISTWLSLSLAAYWLGFVGEDSIQARSRLISRVNTKRIRRAKVLISPDTGCEECEELVAGPFKPWSLPDIDWEAGTVSGVECRVFAEDIQKVRDDISTKLDTPLNDRVAILPEGFFQNKLEQPAYYVTTAIHNNDDIGVACQTKISRMIKPTRSRGPYYSHLLSKFREFRGNAPATLDIPIHELERDIRCKWASWKYTSKLPTSSSTLRKAIQDAKKEVSQPLK